MTDIRIEKMVLENFKCHRWLELDFGGRNAAIYGDNAAGKTTVADAFAWLLYGKDSRGGSQQVRPVTDSGELADREAVTAVEATLRVNGKRLTLRRALREVWTARRDVSLGCVGEYAVDGAACRHHAFQARVAALVDEEVFFLLSSVYRFARDLSWQKRRELLLAICGEAGTAADPQRSPSLSEGGYGALYEAMGDTPPARFREQLLARRRALAGAKNQIPARLSECQRTQEAVGALHYTAQRMEQLRTESETAAKELSRVENLLTMLGEHTRRRAAALEETAGRLFRVVRFRLSRVLQCGTVEDRCDVLLGGVPYGALNTGAQVNGGIDIVNTLSAHFGVWVPLFVDNAEGVTRLEPCKSQVIRLAVSEGEQGLRVECHG